MSIREPYADFEPRRHTLSPMQGAQSVSKGLKVVGAEADRAGRARPARRDGRHAGPRKVTRRETITAAEVRRQKS